MTAILSLGMFVFSVTTLSYDQLQRRTEWRHAKTARVGVRDATQYLGEGDETISLSGTAYAELSDGGASIDQLRDMAGQGDAWPLVCANGRVYGSYVITNIDERQMAFYPDGTPRSIDFGIDLLRVDETMQATQP